MEDQQIQKGVKLAGKNSFRTWFKKGHLDLVPSEARKKAAIKISQKLKGKHNSPKTEFRAGKEHPYWRGGKIPPYQKERNRFRSKSAKWKELILERDEYTCQQCGQKGGRLEVHHICGWQLYPAFRFAEDNGMTFCHQCHKLTDNYGRYKKNYATS